MYYNYYSQIRAEFLSIIYITQRIKTEKSQKNRIKFPMKTMKTVLGVAGENEGLSKKSQRVSDAVAKTG